MEGRFGAEIGGGQNGAEGSAARFPEFGNRGRGSWVGGGISEENGMSGLEGQEDCFRMEMDIDYDT